jgi:hypothetical protein
MTPRPIPSVRWRIAVGAVLVAVSGAVAGGCGYTTRPGLASYLRTVYVKPFENTIDITALTTTSDRFPVYRHGMETNLTQAVINRFQFTGLLRPAPAAQADAILEGELVEFRRDPLRYSDNSEVEEWRLSLVVNLQFYDTHTKTLLWEEGGFVGDTTYFAIGTNAESETAALSRANEDLARRIVERTVESW